MGLLRGAFLFCAVAALTAAGATAQTVVGTVVDEGTQEPLLGVFVVLEDEAGERQATALSGEGGLFVVRAPGPGRYRLVAQLIGYADAAGELLDLGSGETVERRLAVSVRAIGLAGIRAEVGTRCRSRPDPALRAGRLWEEARKALQVAAWAQQEEALGFQLVKRRSELDARSLKVMSMEETRSEGYYVGSPYRSVPAETLEEGGWVQSTPDGDWDHFAPDADVLLSSSFLDTHCFSARKGSDERVVGLAFEPVSGRDVPEIEGVLWLDGESGELRHLEFTYVNLPYEHGDWPQVGGRVEFERLSTGIWLVRRWHVRMPLAAEWIGGFGGGHRQFELRSLMEEAGEVSWVGTRAGETLAEATGATVYGIVEDSVSGRALAGAIVEVLSIGRTTTTGPDGVYRMSGLPSGTFEVRVSHPELELLGGPRPSLDVRLEPGRATRLPVRPSLTGLAVELCARSGTFRDPVVLYGAVLDPANGAPVPGGLVRIFGAGPERRVATDSTGWFTTCLERSEATAVELAAADPADLLRERETLDRRTVQSAAGAIVRADVTLPPPSPSAALAADESPDRSRRWNNVMIGTVRSADDRAPIAGAMVLIRKVDGSPVYSAVTDEEGRFRFAHPDRVTDEYSLTVEHVAYGKASRDITFGSGEELDVEVLLAGQVIGLDPIVVTQRRRGFLAEMGFYDRLEHGMGQYIEREEIERRAPGKLTDLFQGRRGLKVMATGSFGYDIRLLERQSLGDNCQPALWLDGSLARVGGFARDGQVQLSDLISPEHVEAIEIYTGAAGMPMQYGGHNTACGVVLIWTRRG